MDASLPVGTNPFAKPRRPWLAGVLSLLFGPLGQIYVGRLRRSLLFWLVGGCLIPLLLIGGIGHLPGRFGLVLVSVFVIGYTAFLVTDAVLLARRHRIAPLKRYQRWWVYVAFLFAFHLGGEGIARLGRDHLAEAFVVSDRGMVPTILPGDKFLVDKVWFEPERIRRNDVVVFHSAGPDSPLFVQRVIGLPGEVVEIRNERVFINGTALDDPHASFAGPLPPARFYDLIDHGPTKIPSNCCFLMGDNRRLSKDSRIIGPIPLPDLYGAARWIYWSRELTFPDPNDTMHYIPGPFRWRRFGKEID